MRSDLEYMLSVCMGCFWIDAKNFPKLKPRFLARYWSVKWRREPCKRFSVEQWQWLGGVLVNTRSMFEKPNFFGYQLLKNFKGNYFKLFLRKTRSTKSILSQASMTRGDKISMFFAISSISFITKTTTHTFFVPARYDQNIPRVEFNR